MGRTRIVAGLGVLIALGGVTPASAQAPKPRRSTVWDLKLGEPAAAQPASTEFQSFACGSNGGAPRQKLTGWADFAKCRADTSGLHEVYFEYDDELEYIARARDQELDITRWAGTSELGYPVITSALFDDKGVLQAVRVVTDPRPDHREDIVAADVSKRTDAYKFGGVMAARLGIDPPADCKPSPAAEGEGSVGGIFVKISCEKVDEAKGRRVSVRTNFFRKPGQSAYNPQMPTQLTKGQFESSARAEIYALPTR